MTRTVPSPSAPPPQPALATCPTCPTCLTCPTCPKEWNAASYHKVAAPQTAWGRRVLSRLTVRGDERVIDAGCGTGRLTGELMAMFPRGRLIAIDRSWNMLHDRARNLRPDFGNRVAFARVELPRLPFVPGPISSSAPQRFTGCAIMRRSSRTSSRASAGRPAVCAVRRRSQSRRGARARRRRHARASRLRRTSAWEGVWEFATPRSPPTAAGGRLRRRRRQPGSGADDARRRSVVSRVRDDRHLQPASRAAAGRALRARFIDEITARAAREDPPFTLDYWRLNLEGRKP